MLFDAVRKLSEPQSATCLPGYTGWLVVNGQFESERYCKCGIILLYIFLVKIDSTHWMENFPPKSGIELFFFMGNIHVSLNFLELLFNIINGVSAKMHNCIFLFSIYISFGTSDLHNSCVYPQQFIGHYIIGHSY